MLGVQIIVQMHLFDNSREIHCSFLSCELHAYDAFFKTYNSFLHEPFSWARFKERALDCQFLVLDTRDAISVVGFSSLDLKGRP